MVGQPPQQRTAPDDDVALADDVDEGAKPQRRPFVAVDVEIFAYVEDGRISPTAALLYVALLRHYNPKRIERCVWPSRATLARAVGIKKVDNVDRHLKMLKDAGLISWTARTVGKMKASNCYELHLIADVRGPEEVPPPAGYRTPAQRGLDPPRTGDELEQGELPQDELDPTKNCSRTASPPLAALASATARQKSTATFDDPWASDVKSRDDNGKIDDWRPDDKLLFQSLVGDRLRTNGEHWGKDGQIFTASAFYQAFRLRGTPRKINWPGRFLAKIQNDGMEIDDWLISQGLERV